MIRVGRKFVAKTQLSVVLGQNWRHKVSRQEGPFRDMELKGAYVVSTLADKIADKCEQHSCFARYSIFRRSKCLSMASLGSYRHYSQRIRGKIHRCINSSLVLRFVSHSRYLPKITKAHRAPQKSVLVYFCSHTKNVDRN